MGLDDVTAGFSRDFDDMRLQDGLGKCDRHLFLR